MSDPGLQRVRVQEWLKGCKAFRGLGLRVLDLGFRV